MTKLGNKFTSVINLLGFGIDDFDETVLQLEKSKIPFSLESTQTDFAFIAIIGDPKRLKFAPRSLYTTVFGI
jgi:hypothetical protein